MCCLVSKTEMMWVNLWGKCSCVGVGEEMYGGSVWDEEDIVYGVLRSQQMISSHEANIFLLRNLEEFAILDVPDFSPFLHHYIVYYYSTGLWTWVEIFSCLMSRVKGTPFLREIFLIQDLHEKRKLPKEDETNHEDDDGQTWKEVGSLSLISLTEMKEKAFKK